MRADGGSARPHAVSDQALPPALARSGLSRFPAAACSDSAYQPPELLEPCCLLATSCSLQCSAGRPLEVMTTQHVGHACIHHPFGTVVSLARNEECNDCVWLHVHIYIYTPCKWNYKNVSENLFGSLTISAAQNKISLTRSADHPTPLVPINIIQTMQNRYHQ